MLVASRSHRHLLWPSVLHGYAIRLSRALSTEKWAGVRALVVAGTKECQALMMMNDDEARGVSKVKSSEENMVYLELTYLTCYRQSVRVIYSR